MDQSIQSADYSWDGVNKQLTIIYMSLDVYLERKKWTSYDAGVTFTESIEMEYSRNITHNL